MKESTRKEVNKINTLFDNLDYIEVLVISDDLLTSYNEREMFKKRFNILKDYLHDLKIKKMVDDRLEIL